MRKSRLTTPRILVDVERGNWGFKIARIGETISTQRAKFGQDVVRSIYLLDILGFLRSILYINALEERLTSARRSIRKENLYILNMVEKCGEIRHTYLELHTTLDDTQFTRPYHNPKCTHHHKNTPTNILYESHKKYHSLPELCLNIQPPLLW